MKKKFLILAFVFLMIFQSPALAEEEKEVKIKLNDQVIEMDIKPYLDSGRTMIPVRYVEEALGGEYFFSTATHPLKGLWIWKYNEDFGLTMFPGYPVSLIGNSTYRTDVPAMTINSITYVPLRFVADYLNYEVDWDQETFTVLLTEKAEKKDDWERMEKYFDPVAYKKLNDSSFYSLTDFREVLK